MAGQISECGQWMWDGSNWVPNPALNEVKTQSQQQVVMQDSVISGDIIHNDPEAISSAVIAALDRIGLVKGIEPNEQQKQELSAIDQLVQSHEGEIGPEAYYELAESAIMSLDVDRVMDMMGKSHQAAIRVNDKLWIDTARNAQMFFQCALYGQGSLDEVIQLCYVSLEQAKSIGSKKHESIALDLLSGAHANLGTEAGLRKSVEFGFQEIQLYLELGEWEDAALSFAGSMEELIQLGDYQMAEHYFNQAMELIRDHDVHPLVTIVACSGKLKLISATMDGTQAQIHAQSIAKIGFDAGFSMGLNEQKINELLYDIGNVFVDDSPSPVNQNQHLHYADDGDAIMELIFGLSGIFVGIFAIVDVLGSWVGFDLWGSIGIQLDPFIWMISGYIEFALAWFLLYLAGWTGDE